MRLGVDRVQCSFGFVDGVGCHVILLPKGIRRLGTTLGHHAGGKNHIASADTRLYFTNIVLLFSCNSGKKVATTVVHP